jgi:hypothetical protein
LFVVSLLLQVRSAATATLQTAVVSAEVLGVLPGSLERGLREWMLPPLEALSKKMSGKGKRELPQVGRGGVVLVKRQQRDVVASKM